LFVFFLPAKTELIYEAMLKQVKVVCRKLNPVRIMTDFETAATDSLKKTFNNAKMNGCFFHFKQAIIRNFQKHDAVWSTYKKDFTTTLTLNMLLALAYVKIEDVPQAFDDLMASEYFKEAYDTDDDDILDEKTNALKHILSYFESTWIRRFNIRTGRPKRGLFSLDMWNVHQQVLSGFHKTNNVCEGFNGGFNSMLHAA